jgi:hypothetical protein
MLSVTNVLIPKKKLALKVKRYIVEFPDGKETPFHVAIYKRSEVRPKLVIFNKQKPLLKWCVESGVSDAINGGFSMHHKDQLLGEVWTNGFKHSTTQIPEPWQKIRGSALIDSNGHIKIAPRHHLPDEPDGDLLQAGPLLVHKGRTLIKQGVDPDGISETSEQLDDDWTVGRWPRSAIGSNDDYIFCIVTDGYSPKAPDGKHGLSLSELADIFLQLGATEALNLDGGSSTSMVCGSKLVNVTRAGEKNNHVLYPNGRPVPNAIAFEPRIY